MSSKPASKYPHLTDAVALQADAGADERILAIKAGFWIPYDRAKETLDHMEELLAHPPIERMPNLLIVGASNNGKTQILKHFMEQHPINPNPEGDAARISAIRVDAPPTPDIGELCVRILDAIKAPHKEVGSAMERLRTVKKVLDLVGTRMLLVDEIHNMLTGGPVKQREFRNGLKDLGNGLRIPIVAAGIEESFTVFSTDPQLSNRFNPEFLPLWRLDQDTGRLLASMERRFPLRKPSNLIAAEMLQKIVFMSEGLIGEIHSLLKEAAIKAIRDGAEQITLKILDGVRWTRPSERRKRPPT